MADIAITDLTAASSVLGTELLELAKRSTSVTITATTISAAASDNSYNDSATGFLAAGFAIGDRVNVSGFTGDTANNIFAAVVTAVTAGKLTIGGTDGDVIVDDAAGESVTITKWVSRRASAQNVADAATSKGPYTATMTLSAVANATWNIPAACKNFTLQSADITGTTACSFNIHLQRQSDSANATIDTALTTISSAAATTFDQFPAATFGFQVDPTAATWKIGIKHVTCEVPRSTSDKTRIRGDIAVKSATQFIRIYSSTATTAEDHDKLYFAVTAGTMSGTVHITYWT